MARPDRLLLALLLLVLAVGVGMLLAQAGAGRAVAGALLDFQRAANRMIALQMRAIRDGTTTGPLLAGLVLAFLYGALHATGPGHGKLVVVSYFLARDARIGRGLLMGVQIAAMHVLSAAVIVVFADFLLRRGLGGAPAETLAVRVASYALILLIGLAMLARGVRRARVAPTHDRLDHACSCGAHHGESGLLSLGVGLVPCTGSLLILLYSMANGILTAGIALVAMIALGMAVTMGALGLTSVLARRLVAERLAGGAGRATLALDLAGAAAITLLGAVLLAGALRP